MPSSSPPAADPDTRARTHLANERTFLAWLRTGVASIAVGLAAAQFLTRDVTLGFPIERWVAAAFVLSGIFVVFVGAWRAVGARKQIEQASFSPRTWPIIVAGGLALLTGVLALAFVLVLPR